MYEYDRWEVRELAVLMSDVYIYMTDVRYVICDYADVGCMNMTDVRYVICHCAVVSCMNMTDVRYM